MIFDLGGETNCSYSLISDWREPNQNLHSKDLNQKRSSRIERPILFQTLREDQKNLYGSKGRFFSEN